MLLQQFIDFIRSRKSVDLEELAAEFGLRVQVSTDPALLRYAEAYMHMPATEPSQVDRKRIADLAASLLASAAERPSDVHGSQHSRPTARLDACADAVCRTQLTG